MSIKQRIRKIEQRHANSGGKTHVIVKFPEETKEEAISRYEEHSKINPDDDITIIKVVFV